MCQHLILAALLLLPTPPSDGDAVERDRFTVNVQVAAQRIEGVADLDYRAREDGVQEIAFYLGKDLEITRVECDGLVDHDFASDGSFVSATAYALTLHLDAPLHRGERRAIHLEYAGPLPAAFSADHEWVEFFADQSLAPLHTSLTRELQWECRVTLDDPRYRVFGFGECQGPEDGVWTLRATLPCGDVPFVAGTDLEVSDFEDGPYHVQVAHRGGHPEALQRLAEQALWILQLYNDTFGVDEPRHTLKFVVRPTAFATGYARPGYILLSREVLADSSPDRRAERATFAFLAHEIGHLWWSLGDPSGFENWLNESFAEYSSMLALRERFGDGAFADDLAAKRKQVTDEVPAVRDVVRTDPRATLVFYRKGPLLLHDVERAIGPGAFLEWLTYLVSERVRTTDDLLALLEELHGEEVAGALREALAR